MTDERARWTEEESAFYREIAGVAVPARAEQIATLLTLLPFGRDESFRTVDVGSGEGALASALLDCFPNAAAVALDGSATMRAEAARRLSPFGSRASVAPFDLTSSEWLAYVRSADCVLSSLVLHHLSGRDKQALFAAIGDRLSHRGVFLIADLVEPRRPEARALFAATWDRLAAAQSRAQTGSDALFERFTAAQWNYYRFPDPFDRPSPLFDQLTWLRSADFEVVDCFWLQAGHAIYGGYKTRAQASSERISFEAALRSARAALS
ncbi:MAG: class I SAM-dependent methyltransferase [Ardenticatenaceae bacterium]|nr:class I SAM-dependent methyltransferase [Ardenticatenaceae bacterium]